MINNGVIYLGFLPLIASYYFFFKVIIFIYQLRKSFDLGCCFFYKKNIIIKQSCLYKLEHYRKYLIFGVSIYDFKNDFGVEDKEHPENMLYIVEQKDFIYGSV